MRSPPRFVFEHLDEAGNAIETKESDGAVDCPKDAFAKGWEDTQGMIAMSVSGAKLEPGRWKVTARGVIGEETWRSEFVEITIPPAN